MESYTNGLYTFTVNRLSKVCGVAGKYKSHLWIIKRYGSLFLLHGSVPVASCIPFVFVYCLHTVSLVMYETSGACLISMQETDILKFDGVVGIAIRIPAVLLLYWLGLGSIGFAISTILDFAGRGLYNEIRLHSVVNSSVK